MVFRFHRFEFDQIMIPGGRMGSEYVVKLKKKAYKGRFLSIFFFFKNHYPRKIETYVEASTDV